MNKNTIVCLQNIILDSFYNNEKSLYINVQKCKNSIVYDTSTYMNIFSLKIWNSNADIISFYLSIKYEGRGEIVLHYVNKSLEPMRVENIVLDRQFSSCIYRLVSGQFEYVFISWKENSEFRFKQGAWLGERVSLPHAINLAICIPTYKRIDDISGTIALYEKCCQQNIDFSSSSCLYVYNNDTSVDLMELSSLSNVSIINSENNIGGAGAFHHCARLAVKEGYTHVLFMDDDALPHAEAWLRTLALLRVLKQEKKEHFIAGNALIRENPKHCHAVREAIDKRGYIKGYKLGNYALTKKQELIDALAACVEHNPQAGAHPYAAWWYCVIPCSSFKLYGWPDERYFFGGDDIDFSLTCKAKIICCNGINVWHPSFERPKTLQRRYLSVRNHYATLEKHFGSKNLFKLFLGNVFRLIRKKEFAYAEITACAFCDFVNKKYLDISKIICVSNINHGKFISLFNIIKILIKIVIQAKLR